LQDYCKQFARHCYPTSRQLKLYKFCGERRHHKGEPDVARLQDLPEAIETIKHAESRHWILDNAPTVVLPGETPIKETQTVYTKRFGKNKAH
jgi:hypothetical protein